MDNKSFNLNKKRILLIGATGVLGATYAKALKEEGCRLVIFDHPETNINDFSNFRIREALTFNKSLLMENFILPHKLKLPVFRNILEKYYN